MAEKTQAINYESALRELESILAELETPQLELATLHGKVARAQELLLFCRAKLKDVSLDLAALQEAAAQNQQHAE